MCWGRAQGSWWGADSYVNKQTPRLGQEPLVLRDRKAFPLGAIWTLGQVAPTAPSSAEPASRGPAAMSPGAAQRQCQKIKGQSVRVAHTVYLQSYLQKEAGREEGVGQQEGPGACELQSSDS